MVNNSQSLPVVRYQDGCLADVLPSALAALGVLGELNLLGLAATRRVVLLLVDGLGWNLLKRNPEVAPLLNSLPGQAITAGFPSTTVTSIACLGTGVLPGVHGLTGYTSYVEEVSASVNWLAWRPVGESRDLRTLLVPEVLQPRTTAFERAAAAGVEVSVVSAKQFDGSGLTRAVLRGGRYVGTFTPGDVVAQAASASGRDRRSLVYCYTGDLDLVGHVRGPESDPWLAQLGLIDRFVEQLIARLPVGATLLITGDHGMVTVGEDDKIDFDASPMLQDGVVALAGEPRTRYVHVRPGAAGDVLAAWQARLGDRMWVLGRDQAIEAGWFGPTVNSNAAARIGDVLAVSHSAAAVVRRSVEADLSALAGQHGALTDDELFVPLLHNG